VSGVAAHEMLSMQLQASPGLLLLGGLASSSAGLPMPFDGADGGDGDGERGGNSISLVTLPELPTPGAPTATTSVAAPGVGAAGSEEASNHLVNELPSFAMMQRRGTGLTDMIADRAPAITTTTDVGQFLDSL
jgi:hypothetical protein